MKEIIQYFIKRPVVVNSIMFGLIFASIIAWQQIGKEEMPEFAMNFLRISIRYPGASAEDVESFLTKPIEEQLKGISALREVHGTSSFGSCSIRVIFEPNISNLQEKIQEVKDAVDAVDMPNEIRKEPTYHQFRSSEKAIIDVGIFLKNVEILTVKDRITLQKYVLAFKNKILSLPEISGVDNTGYLRPELQVKVYPELLEKHEISLNQIKAQITAQNIRQPIGSIKDKRESEVSIISELNDVASLNDVIISAGFQGQKLKLSQIAKIENGFEDSTKVTKVQGHEGVVLNIKKSSNTDILSAQKAIVRFIETFQKNDPLSPVSFILMDDESYDVRNRLSLISVNGLIGFALIVIILFLFLDFKSGIWVGMGIPFSLAFTLVMAMALGFTVNNMTLASIIIVLGIVVDDAIIIAENIVRNRKKDHSATSVIDVGLPVIASVLTTCAAFIPLYFFSGRFGMFVKYIPTIIFLMLFASIIESFFILPSHMTHKLKITRFFPSMPNFSANREKILVRAEQFYQMMLFTVLKHRFYVLIGFLVLLITSATLFKYHLRYVMFPREESRDFRLRVTGPEKATRYETAKLIKKVENIFLDDNRNIVTAVRSNIGQNRRGGEVKENEASIRVEITPPSERDISFNQLLKEWQRKTKKLKEFQEIRFQRSRFGSDSGSPIAIEIQENNDNVRKKVVNDLFNSLQNLDYLTNVEIEKPVTKNEYRLDIKKNEVSRLGIDYAQLSSTLRAYIEGDILYTLNSGEEEVDLRFTSNDQSKDDIHKILEMTVANNSGYLVPINNLVTVQQNEKPANIQRVNFKRATMVYADIVQRSGMTPLDIATILENDVFPKILAGKPTTNLEFKGEIEDSRESQQDFILSVAMVLVIIYIILIFLFDSLTTPLVIGSIIPFGIVGTVLAFTAHGLSQYGFFAIVGTLGMIGVVINDSIVLVDKLEKNISDTNNLLQNISILSTTRLKAIVITTVTTVAGLFPTAYGIGGYDSMLAEMMLAMGWGLMFGMVITLFLTPSIYTIYAQFKFKKWRLNAH